MHVLLVVHEATLTGAPRVALQVAFALRAASHEVVGLLRWHGPIERELLTVATSVMLEPLRHLRAATRRVAPRARFTNSLEQLVAFLALLRAPSEVVYLNSVKSACYVRPALRLGRRVILHVHEVEPLASTTLRRYRLDAHYAQITLVACSEAARKNLARIAGVDERRITVAESTIDMARVLDLSESPAPVRLPVSDGELVVGACGVANAGKGVDLWLDMAKRLACAPDLPPIRFVWIGARASEARELARARGLDGIVDFCGELDNPYALIRRMDVFTLPSRADAYPLVVLEAMALGRPVVAFDVGGVAEQLGDAGILVPPENVRAFSEGVAGLLKARTRRVMLGAAAQERARQRLDPHRFEKTVVRLVDGSV